MHPTKGRGLHPLFLARLALGWARVGTGKGLMSKKTNKQNELKATQNFLEATGSLNSEAANIPSTTRSASSGPRPHPTPVLCTRYLHKEKGGEPLPELHLRLTAEVPAGEAWVWVPPGARLRREHPAHLPSPGSQGMAQIWTVGDPLRGNGLPPLLGLGSQDGALAHHCCFSCFSVSCTTVKPQLQRNGDGSLDRPWRSHSPGSRDRAQKHEAELGAELRATASPLTAPTFLTASQAQGSPTPPHPRPALVPQIKPHTAPI